MKTVFMILVFILPLASHGFSLDARSVNEYFKRNSEPRSRIPFLDHSEGIHEALTNKSIECKENESTCAKLAQLRIYPKDIIDGVQWNDFPGIYYTESKVPLCNRRILNIRNDHHVACIVAPLIYASKTSPRKLRDPNWIRLRPISVRGHYGDLQFLHAMAEDGESAEKTLSKLMNWMEFSYLVSLKKVNLNAYVETTEIQGMKVFFGTGARKAKDLLNYSTDKDQAAGLALGQMLHIIQDSFSKCHTIRDENGKIIQFLSYRGQNFEKHKKHDLELESGSKSVEFGRELLQARANSMEWKDVKLIVQKYFELSENTKHAGPGEACS